MTKKHFQILLAVIIVLVIALFGFDRAEENSVRKESKLLLSGVNSDQISKVVLEQGKNKVELTENGDGWNVVQRSGYPADLSKLRSLLLKLIDLTVSQRVTSNTANFEKLGVADSSYQKEGDKGPAKVTFQDNSGRELAAILLGDKKKRNVSRKDESMEIPAGQFIRKAGDDEVYLLAETIELTVSPEGMIATDLLSVPSAKVKRVLQEKVDGTARVKLFDMLSVKEADGKIRFDLDLEPTGKQEIQKTIVDSIAAGLENVRIQDVMKDTPENAKKFDQSTTYELSTGAVYRVETAVEKDKAYARYSVSFNKTLAENTVIETEKINEKKKADHEGLKNAAEASKESPPPELVLAKPDVITEEEAQKENKKLSGWIYEFPTYQIEKYRRGESDLIKDKVAPSQPAN